jgi:hypothetical protein
VERSVKEQRFGASATLIGMRNLRQRLEMRVAVASQKKVIEIEFYTYMIRVYRLQ